MADRPVVLHVTTAHRADDVRIFERECRSLANSGKYGVYLAAAGRIPVDSGVTLIPLNPVPTSRVGRFSGSPLKVLGLSRALSVDLWHLHDPELLPVCLRLARSGVPVIWDAHEDYVAEFTEGGGKSWVPSPARGVVRRGMQAMIAAVDRNATGIVAATPSIAARYANPRTVVVGNEARLEDFRGCSPDFHSRRLLFSGQSKSSHLFDEVVDAVGELPDVRLAVAGRKPSPDVWARSSEILGGRLEYLGWLDRANLAAAISTSSLGLALYAALPAYMAADASPTKVYEFAAAGLPVLGSPIPAVISAVETGGLGFLAEGFTRAALRQAISGALEGHAAWQQASENARLWAAASGGWSHSESELLRLYDEILGV